MCRYIGTRPPQSYEKGSKLQAYVILYLARVHEPFSFFLQVSSKCF